MLLMSLLLTRVNRPQGYLSVRERTYKVTYKLPKGNLKACSRVRMNRPKTVREPT